MFSLLCLFVMLVVSHGFDGGTVVLIVPVSVHCLPLPFLKLFRHCMLSTVGYKLRSIRQHDLYVINYLVFLKNFNKYDSRC